VKILNNILLIAIVLFVASCGKKGDGDKPASPPAKAELVFPASSALCTSGAVISPTQTSIVFNWNAAANADSYEIGIKNLLTNTSVTETSSTNQITVTLNNNTPYSWFVVSKSKKISTTAKSDVWKFYLPGAGIKSYSPFPADITAPEFGKNISITGGKVNLTWLGSDVDNDIAYYAVYFGTTTNPPLLQSNISNMFLNDVAVTANKTYYWKVLTKDAAGNTSSTIVYQFKTI
jgi:hypothetical protein